MSQAFIEGLGTTVIGMLIVFGVLSALCFVLYLFKFLPNQAVVKAEQENSNTHTNTNEVTKSIDDMELVAVITASIAAALGTTSDKLVVRSITKVQSWNSVSRREQQRNII